MNFENKGKWLKEAQDKMAARDTMEDPDFLDGDDKVLTFEEEELDIEDDIEEEPTQKNEAIAKSELPKIYKTLVSVFGQKLGRDIVKVRIHPRVSDALLINFIRRNRSEEESNKLYGLRFLREKVLPELKPYGVRDAIIDEIIPKEFPVKEPWKTADESAQKNEAKSERAYDINFDNMGGGFTVEKVAITNGYGIELSGYSSNTSKKLTYVHPTLSNDRGKSQDEIEKNYDALNAKRIAIAKDLKPLADKFDKDIEAIFAKHGFKKA